MAFFFGFLAAFGWAWLAYERWATHGDPIHVQVVDKHISGTDDTSYELDVRVGDVFGGDLETVRSTTVDKHIWERTEIDDFVTARYRSFTLAGRTVEKLSVEGGPIRKILVWSIFWTAAAMVFLYFGWG